jgi:hypothetical protein
VEKKEGSGQTAAPTASGTHCGGASDGRAGVASRGEAPRAEQGRGNIEEQNY